MKFFKKIDIAIISILLVVSILGYFGYQIIFKDTKALAEIYYGSKLIKTIDLSKNKEYIFTPKDNENVKIQVFADGSIAFVHSDCPDQICVHSGRLKLVGESAACLPNNIIIKIVSKDKQDVDLIIGG